jgi:hypothetical protein
MVVVFTSSVIYSDIAIADIKPKFTHLNDLNIEDSRSSSLDFGERTKLLATNFEKDRSKNGPKAGSSETLRIQPIIEPSTDKADTRSENSASETGDYWVSEEGQVTLLIMFIASVLGGTVVSIELMLAVPSNPGYREATHVHN